MAVWACGAIRWPEHFGHHKIPRASVSIASCAVAPQLPTISAPEAVATVI